MPDAQVRQYFALMLSIILAHLVLESRSRALPSIDIVTRSRLSDCLQSRSSSARIASTTPAVSKVLRALFAIYNPCHV